MLLDEIEKYNSQYEKGAKKISLHSKYLRLDRKTIDISLEKSHGNYDLFFNRKGVLLHSVHIEKNKKYELIFGYNQKGLLISVISMLSQNHEMLSLSDFIYDYKGRIKLETVRSFDYSIGGETGTTKSEHTYTDNKEEIFMTNDNELDEDDLTIYHIYDSKQRVIEEKAIRNKDELFWWNKNEYDSKGVMLKEISLGVNGEIDGVYEFFKTENGMNKGYKFSSEDSNYLREYVYTFNKQGHWINQVVMNDGDPIYFYDRTIEYY